MSVKQKVVYERSIKRKATINVYVCSLFVFIAGFLSFVFFEMCLLSGVQAVTVDWMMKAFLMGCGGYLSVLYLCYAYVDRKWERYSDLRLAFLSLANFLIGCGFLSYVVSMYFD